MTGSHSHNDMQFTTHDRDNAESSVLRHIKVPGGTITVTTLTSTASTSVELTTVMVSGGTTSTQPRVATHSSGQK